VSLLSLRARLFLGAMLWTLGLCIAAVLMMGLLLMQNPGYPRAFHATAHLHSLGLWVFAAICLAAGVWQVWRGVASVDQLRAHLAAIRDGRTDRLEGAYPKEVQPLVEDLNALLDQREAAVARALAKAGDLAHGLKTPLAVLAHEADRTAAAGHAELGAIIGQQVERMRRHTEYHLAQARAAASGSSPGTRASLHDSAAALSRTLLRLHAGRGIFIDNRVDSGLVVRCQREDLDEMLGNLLDNACKWARARVTVAASRSTGEGTGDAVNTIAVVVDDDGPGLAAEMRTAVLQRGVRADEAAPGTGLGLAIVRELAGLYGGSIALEDSPEGGVRAVLTLPSI
jgi:signal transduction histidine kinase